MTTPAVPAPVPLPAPAKGLGLKMQCVGCNARLNSGQTIITVTLTAVSGQGMDLTFEITGSEPQMNWCQLGNTYALTCG